MKFHELPVAGISIRVKGTEGSSLAHHFALPATAIPVAHVAASETNNSFELSLTDSLVAATPIKETDAQRLNNELNHGRAMLSQLSNLAPDGSAELGVKFFLGSVVEMGNVEIGIDEYVERGINRIERRRVRDIYPWLEDRCTFTHLGETYFFLTVGPALEDFLANDNEEAEDGEGVVESLGRTSAEVHEIPRTDPNYRNSFCVTGSDMRFVSTTTALPDGSSIYVVTKLTTREQDTDKTIRLARGSLKFVDWTRTGKIQIQTRAQLTVLTADEASYLKRWDEFGDREGELLLNTARTIGAIEFTDPRPNKNGTVDVSVIKANPAAIEALATGQLNDLELVDTVPEYLTDPAFSFSDFTTVVAGNLNKSLSRGTHIEVGRYDRQTRALTLTAESVPPVGTLVVSMTGDVAQIKRRQQARNAILQGRSANPQLGLLVEEKGEITSLRSPQRVKPLTAFVREKVFNNPPTVRQEQAIDVALNTPDIAVIQGPPGTGKTTVIAAILERLNEEASRQGGNGQGQVLLSGFQHDAVENMIDRISLNGIPVPKFGKRSGSTEDDLNAFERSLEEWCENIARNLRKKNPQIAELEEESALKDLYRQYLRNPTHKAAATLVGRIAAVPISILGERLARQAASLNRRLSTEELVSASQSRHLPAAQRLRTRPESFADDGPESAEGAVVDLEDVLDEHQMALLEKASAWDPNRGTPPFLAELSALKRSLLVQLTAPPVFRVEKHSDEVLELAEQSIEQVKSHGFTAHDKKSAALASFLAELENNPFGMVDAVSEFSYAFSATVQQSVNRKMQDRKGITSGSSDESLEYEYVIVDEAARVSPRDLMIPMSQGKKIILVGDHRQLPHIIDEEVARRMEEGEGDSDENEWLKKSMFQYLFSERLKALEEADGITRRVTLDKQFRMHPDLGDFVSRNFYERFDTSEQFGSGLPSGAFSHSLSGTDGKPAMWLHVPGDAGPGRKSGTSWTRQPEVDAIVRQLKEWIESPEGSDLTYGVISFYKAQADLIRLEVRRQLGPLGDDDKRIRVGTVDSFQGMEFDVVFLSIVRTVPPNWLPRDTDRAKQARSLFGHLGLYNRLNVSMSRQKRLLVAVGDPALVTHDLAIEFIPGLVDFYTFAQSTSAINATARQRTSPAPQMALEPASADAAKPAGSVFSRLFRRENR